MSEGTIQVEVAYATLEKQTIVALDVPVGTTLGGAIELSRLEQDFPEIAVDKKNVGVFGKRRSVDDPLREGDRVEIYRPLIADPKEMRRQKATQKT